MAIAVPDDLQESVGPGADGCVWQGGDLPANHRASGCALEAGRKAIWVQGELQESMGPGSEGRARQVGELPANHRASQCAL